MRLIELEPHFVTIIEPGVRYSEAEDITIAQAQGIRFLCPKCFEAKDPNGVHSILCWFLGRGVSADELPGPGRWEPVGTGLRDLTLRAGSSSIQLTTGCQWHGFIANGEVTHS